MRPAAQRLATGTAAAAALMIAACAPSTDTTDMTNPFMTEWTLPHGAVPFDQIKTEHYKPAILAGIEQDRRDHEAIAQSAEAPTFENTIVAMQYTGRALDRVLGVFYNMLECDGTDDMLALAEEMQPVISQHQLDMRLDPQLFARVETVWQQYADSTGARRSPQADGLSEADWRLLKDTYEGYVRGGATLKGEARERWRALSAELDSLTLAFGQNVQKATGEWSYQLDPATDLEGLPDFVTETLREGGYRLTLLAPDYRPFMKYSSRRDLREMLWRAYNTRCVGGPYDNVDIQRRIAMLRQEKAALLGYKTFAHYRLTDTMAGTPEAVTGLLGQLLDAYRQPAEADVKAISDYAHSHGLPEGETLMPWDFTYYADQLKTERYAFNDALLKPYLPLDQVKRGVFGLATRLYGVTFRRLDVPVYAPEVECYEVVDGDGSYLGLLYTDFFPRKTKRPGAWMTEFKGQWREPASSAGGKASTVDGLASADDGQVSANSTATASPSAPDTPSAAAASPSQGIDSRPIIQIVMSFSRPIGTPGDSTYTPALLTYDECTTFLHEFGHSLHGLLTRCTYPSQSGTNVAHDFVELPSQFNENFMREREFLDTFAADYQTGERIPQELIDRLRKASNFLAGYNCLRQLSFGMLDMAYHTLGAPTQPMSALSHELEAGGRPGVSLPQSVEDFERTAMAPTAVMPTVDGTMMGPSFTHIFSGGYAAGYYGYKWAEVLDADAFAVFEREGLFNPATAQRFRHLLESGDAVDPAELYRSFKGSGPSIDALMRRDGIIR